MLASFIVMFREVLEIALLSGILITYLDRKGAGQYKNLVWSAIAMGIALSILLAMGFDVLAGGFTGKSEQIYEGILMIAGAILVTSLILWMIREGNYAKKLTSQIERAIDKKAVMGIFSITLIAVLREGIEIVFFMYGVAAKAQGGMIIGAVLGTILAIAAGIIINIAGKRIGLYGFFMVTNIILILFAAGMLSYGVHELQEAGIIPTVIEHVYDINPPVVTEGVYPLLHEKGALGSIAKSLFGYNGNPSLIESLTYVIYLISVGFYWKRSTHEKNDNKKVTAN
ncbi:FTR1 family protein [Spirochaetia bacterium 38H-sp]|uniref:FTR1 family protein n=1 Tax=Rarispira pelagica TaxID=3141764 RepID=A0ABU9UAA4_9SPIR